MGLGLGFRGQSWVKGCVQKPLANSVVSEGTLCCKWFRKPGNPAQMVLAARRSFVNVHFWPGNFLSMVCDGQENDLQIVLVATKYAREVMVVGISFVNVYSIRPPIIISVCVGSGT